MNYHHIMEIGAGDRASSQALNYWRETNLITLYEPNTILYNDLIKAYDILPNNRIRFFNKAVSNTNGFGDLFHLGYASFLNGSPSFLSLSCESNYEQFWEPLKKQVQVGDILTEDKAGDVDFLILTVNGCEVEILSSLVSIPRIIRTKHYLHNHNHWQEANKLFEWMKLNNYYTTVLETNQYNTYFHLQWEKRK